MTTYDACVSMSIDAGDNDPYLATRPSLVVVAVFVCLFLVICEGEIAKSDLEKLVKDKEAVELKAAEQRQVLGGE